ncbi:MAG: FtsX-like permease family protein [Bacteroidetes bacterium]|jgi:lipoprotein-releasing system permease protein|nr:FtsX-like permease family protein [Bacteroidota bacterium]
MRIIFSIARRYLFSKSTTNLINIITGLSVAGLATGACVLILVMSVFNGLETTILSFFNAFNPDLKVEVREGKTFSLDEERWSKLQSLDAVDEIAKSLEEVVLFEHMDRREVGKIKGVTENFVSLNRFDSTIIEGDYKLYETDNAAVAGVGIGSQLDLNILDPLGRLKVYALTAKSRPRVLGSPFEKLSLRPTGLFSIQQEYDRAYVFAPLEVVQELLKLDGQYSALEIGLKEGSSERSVIRKIEAILGSDFRVLNRYEQEEEFLRLMSVEKWMAFVMLSFASLLVAFNMVGTLWLIVLDKRRDLSLLQSLGMTSRGLSHIILTLGGYIAALGFSLGTIAALILYYAQKTYSLVGVPDSFSVNAYPVELRLSDFLLTAIIIVCIGLLAALPAAYRAKQIPSYLLEE